MKILMAENLVWAAQVRVGSHHIAARFLSHGHEVFWLSLPWAPPHVLKGFRYERIREWNCGRPFHPETRLQVYCPLTLLPYRNHAVLRRAWVARGLLGRCVPPLAGMLRRAGFRNVDLLWMSDPRMISLRRIVSAKAWAYRCVDELSAFSDIPPGVEQMEREVVEQSDVVFATAEDLQQRLQRWRPDVHRLPNAADVDHFTEPAAEPEDMRAYPRPRVLYVGTLGEWFDAELVRETARRLPHCQFLLVGPRRAALDLSGGLTNVHYLGVRPYEAVPGYVQHCDVAIIPFRVSRLSRAVNPLKVYEYLAAGKPVVSTPLPELARQQLPVWVAEGAAAFAESIRAALNSDEAERRRRIRVAADHSWDERFLRLAAVLRQATGLELLDAGQAAESCAREVRASLVP